MALALVAAVLMLTLPTTLSPLYTTSSGAVVIDVIASSPFDSHIAAGDSIVSLGDCAVTDRASLVECVTRLTDLLDKQQHAHGYCSTALALQFAEHDATDCCSPMYTGALQCFTPVARGGQYDEIAPEQRYCMSAKKLADNAICHTSAQCESPLGGMQRPLLHIQSTLLVHDVDWC
jgi:hypothetical protein